MCLDESERMTAWADVLLADTQKASIRFEVSLRITTQPPERTPLRAALLLAGIFAALTFLIHFIYGWAGWPGWALRAGRGRGALSRLLICCFWL